MTRNDIRKGVRQVVTQVVSLARPRRVILFGSAAEGRIGPDSDFDFLVVVPEGRDVRQVTAQLNVGVRARPMPCDFLVVTPSTLRKHRRTPGMVYGEILERGREVYAV
jgi:predicted nucleotidyltransferase